MSKSRKNKTKKETHSGSIMDMIEPLEGEHLIPMGEDSDLTRSQTELLQRSYFSEATAQSATPSMQPENIVRPHSTLSEINTDKSLPPAKIFQGPPTVEAILGKADDDYVLDTDFPTTAYEPKVQLQYVVKPGALPRMVQVERLRRIYEKQNLEEILEERGVNVNDLIMTNPHTNIIKTETGLLFTPYLPIELFDDTDFNLRSSEDWLSKALDKEGVRKALPAKAYLPIDLQENMTESVEYQWKNVGVLDYDEDTMMWLVQPVNSKGRILEEGKPAFWKRSLDHLDWTKLNPNQIWVPRVRLKFFAEDAHQFASRILDAVAARDKAEQTIRYWLCVDGMPTEGMTAMTDDMIERISKASVNARLKEIWPLFDYHFANFLKEAKLSYQKCMNRLLFDNLVTTDPELKGVITYFPPKPTHEVEYKAVPHIVRYSFASVQRKFIFRSFLVFKEAVWTMAKVREECNKPMDMNLFVINSSKSVKLDDFELAQSQATQQVHLFLKDSWSSKIVIDIRGFIQYVGKGWFNVNETNWTIYQMSKLKKFLKVVKYMMQDSLRYLVLGSLKGFVQLIIDSARSTLDLKEDFVWGPDLKNSPFKPKKNALFVLDLIVEPIGLRFGTDIENFQNSLANLFIKAVNATYVVEDVEKFVMKSLYWHETPLLDTVTLKEPEVKEMKKELIRAITQALIPLKAYSEEYQQFIPLAKKELSQYIADHNESPESTLMDIKKEVDRLIAYKAQLEQRLPSSIIIGPFLIQIDASRQFLFKKCKALSDGLLDFIIKTIKANVEQVTNEYRTLSQKLKDKPLSLENISEIRDWMKSVPVSVFNLTARAKAILQDFSIPEYYWYTLSDEDFKEKASLYIWPMQIEKQSDSCKKMLAEEEEKFSRLLLLDQANLKDKLDNLMSTIGNLNICVDLSKANEYANEVRKIMKALKECQDLASLYNKREAIIGTPLTVYSIIPKMIKLFEPYKQLWLTAADWLKWYDGWMNDSIASIDPESLVKNVAESIKSMAKLLRVFVEIPSIYVIILELKDQMERFQPKVPAIIALRYPGMRPRHWDEISEKMGFKVAHKTNVTFAKYCEMGLDEHVEFIAGIGEAAVKEFQIESDLEKMESSWKDQSLSITPYKMSGTFTMKISEDNQQMLDDQIVNTQGITLSPYKKPFEERLTYWEAKLKLIQEVLDEWLKAQRAWLYLEPIFSSEDIVRQLPLESKKYQQMERHWRRILASANKDPDIMSFCSDPMLLKNFKECNTLLEQVAKGLSEYLETKRSGFPRFYFLSDDELLEILSQTKDPRHVQPFLRKCIESFMRLEFSPDLKILSMVSFEGEVVNFTKDLYPVGEIEEWLSRVEDTMFETIRDVIENAIKDYANVARKKFVLVWPGQIVIAVCQNYWTTEVEEALNESVLDEYFQQMLSQLDDLRELVRGELKRNERNTLSALIVIEVHARDVIQGMVQDEVSSSKDFEWIKQLRLYWINSHLYVQAVNAEFRYGYEYLGNTPRLVITPLTDRCYLTLTGALHLKFGGAPAGPAGTGKTETTKDLSKALAIQCVVFNCSDQLDYLAMAKFFKGLASSGAWACFDEFNRIDVEVLSVIAQQLQTIQKAIIARAKRFIFEGCEIALRDTCASFITMNPGYAGRSELPDNLKALFRPVAMMVPDYALIAEISLFSFGFADTRFLARKITSTFKLASEQVSSQDHYDFGMRAVKSVIYAAGNLKREHPKMNEELILLRAIRDINVPKFLQDDLKLFTGIVSDLFPTTPDEPVDYGSLDASIRSACKKWACKDVTGFLLKCIQLYDTTIVRHGLMLVGPAGSGKSKCYQILKTAINDLKGTLNPGGHVFTEVFSCALNPKSITMGQLYGEFNIAQEWTDGILPCLIREGAAVDDDIKRWYVFDGPVDAIWIENMNSVLDDNKKLCLTSGEIIKLNDNQTLIFEVADLSVASPATVSRCGMIYLEPGILGLRPFYECWIEHKVGPNVKSFVPRLVSLFHAFLEPSIQFLRSRAREIVPSMNSNLAFSLLKLLGILLKSVPAIIPETRRAIIAGLVECYFAFALIWSVGATCDSDGRKKFSQFIRGKMELEQFKYLMPREDTVYDYKIDDAQIFAEMVIAGPDDKTEPSFVVWIGWLENVATYVVPNNVEYSEILVPTPDSVRNILIVEMLLLNNYPVLGVGPTGTGKTATITEKLSRGLPGNFTCDFITFSARTTSNQTQDLIDLKLDKRRKGVFGPPPGRFFIFFIDDMNMPAVETYGAQPPIELLRQYMDFSGWYDRKSIGEFRTLIDVNLICAVGPPGGGRNPVTPRFLRHFNYLSYTDLESASMRRIFGTILESWLEPAQEMFKHIDKLVMSSISVYNTIIDQLLPTPAKSHYTFNLRDLSKIFQGMLMLPPLAVTDAPSFLRLWYHENCRVYQDRLINNEDRLWFQKLMDDRMREDFDVPFDVVVLREPILYADFLSKNPDNRLYEEMVNMDRLLKYLEDMLEDYNANNVNQMNLVLFTDAVKHVCRIARVIRQPGGNLLLLGMQGNGRQSLTRLASHLNEMECFQIELVKGYGFLEWREDLKKILLKSGLRKRKMVFLFSDTQIKLESFLEDVNSILNSGNVPNIFGAEEMEPIYQGMRQTTIDAGLPPTKSNLYNTLTKSVKSNLHSVITMSPIGEIFRERLRQFPAFVTCCTINWFSEWPEAALQSVALLSFKQMRNLEASPQVTLGTVAMCQLMHGSVGAAANRFYQELLRRVYVTPKGYMDLLSAFGKIHSIKVSELTDGRDRMNTGLEKLLNCARDVAQLQIDLEILRPQLVIAAKETEVMMFQIAQDTQLAEETRVVVKQEEEQASKKAAETQAIADDAQKDLDQALPALDAALASLKNLNKGDVVELRTMQSPPQGVRMVMEAVCLLKGVKPKVSPGPKPGQKIYDYWEPGKALLQDPTRFLDSLFKFDKENISDDTMRRVGPFIEDPALLPEHIARVSKACTSICEWARAMYKYAEITRIVEPKRGALASAKADLAVTMEALAQAKGRLDAVESGLATLNSKLNAAIKRKQELEDNSVLCEQRLVRAAKLINGLKDERKRWQETVESLQNKLDSILGDVLVSSGSVSYLGPFTEEYRAYLTTEWIKGLKINGVPHTSDPTFLSTMGDPVKIRTWQIAGLPKDRVSIQNALIAEYSDRWPLFIDPQGQANKWIKTLNKDTGLKVFKMTDKDVSRILENAVQNGKAVLLEKIGEELEPVLDPVLLKQTYVKGGKLMLKIGDNVIPYNQDFRFYMTTSLPNPNYAPEVNLKACLLNFTLAPTGLEDQLLATVVAEERQDLEFAKNELIVNNARMKQDLKNLEDQLLFRLSASEGNPVDDIEFIELLEQSKETSAEIKLRVAAAEVTEKTIDATRSQYIPVAVRAQILFFCMSGLPVIDPMYQYSLEWFQALFVICIKEAEKAPNLKVRIDNVNEYFTFTLFTSVCRSLFEKHKLMFAFLMATRIKMNEGKIDMAEWRFLLAGGKPTQQVANPNPDWISDRSWSEILSLSGLPTFADIVKSFEESHPLFKVLFDSVEPQKEVFPNPWEEKLSPFQRILILRAIRPDKVTNAFQDYVSLYLGQKFIEPQTNDLGSIFKDSSSTVPIVFILSSGADPGSDLNKFAEKMKFGKKLNAVSLGQGQGPRAEILMRTAMEDGLWVFFQNCHVAPSWMPSLERLVESIDPDTVHVDFRLWLTSMPSPQFPPFILQNSAKMTVEPPRGIKANLLKVYYALSDSYLDSCVSRENEFKFLLFSLSLFHGVVVERRKFGSLGFNIGYDFTDGDFKICMSQLFMFLMEYEQIAFKVLRYTAAEINYGGRITDDWDRRMVKTVVEDYYNMAVLKTDYIFDPDNKIFRQLNPETSLAVDYADYVRTLPINDNPDIFGLHDNANITFANNELHLNLQSLLLQQPRTVEGGVGGLSRDDQIYASAINILEVIPTPIDLGPIQTKYPIVYEESMNTVLVQELLRYNNILRIIHATLQHLLKALKGLMVLTAQLEEVSNALFNNMVPLSWKKASYPSLKPLASWVIDLKARMNFFLTWIEKGTPNVFWFSGLWFPQAFLTGTTQNYARKLKVAIDTLSWGFQIIREPKEKLSRPSDGCYIYGLFIEGARWDKNNFCLAESNPKELFTEMPVFLLIPMENRGPMGGSGLYISPVYKTLLRQGTLTTSGHSTNYVLPIEVPSKKPQAHWVKRGVAMICALDY